MSTPLDRSAIQPYLFFNGRCDEALEFYRSAIGAEVVIETGDLTQRRVVDGGSGFASQNDRRLHFGLGSHEWVDRVVIYWPSGTTQTISRPLVDTFVTVTEPGR